MYSSSCKRSMRRNTTWSAIYITLQRNIPKFDTVLLHSNWSSLRRKYLSKIPTDKRVELWAKNMKHFGNFGRSMYARVPQAMAQFVLKIELLSHIMGTTPILEMARAYGLRPQLWLLFLSKTLYVLTATFCC